jgi:uncharacterized protein DUF1918
MPTAAACGKGQLRGRVTGYEEEAPAMKAKVGDQLVTDDADDRRICEIIGLHHADGTPPYVVRWASDGHISLLFPGPYRRLVRAVNGNARTDGHVG